MPDPTPIKTMRSRGKLPKSPTADYRRDGPTGGKEIAEGVKKGVKSIAKRLAPAFK